MRQPSLARPSRVKRTNVIPDDVTAWNRGKRYKVIKPYEHVKYYESFLAATTAMRHEVKGLRKLWQQLKVEDSEALCEKLLERISWLDGDGGKVLGRVDTVSGLRYVAELVRLERP